MECHAARCEAHIDDSDSPRLKMSEIWSSRILHTQRPPKYYLIEFGLVGTRRETLSRSKIRLACQHTGARTACCSCIGHLFLASRACEFKERNNDLPPGRRTMCGASIARQVPDIMVSDEAWAAAQLGAFGQLVPLQWMPIFRQRPWSPSRSGSENGRNLKRPSSSICIFERFKPTSDAYFAKFA
jgi:hypothetical protein